MKRRNVLSTKREWQRERMPLCHRTITWQTADEKTVKARVRSVCDDHVVIDVRHPAADRWQPVSFPFGGFSFFGGEIVAIVLIVVFVSLAFGFSGFGGFM